MIRKITRLFCLSLLALGSSLAALAEDAMLLDVPDGVRRVKIEVRDSSTAVWRLHAVAHVDGRAGTVKIRLPEGVHEENVRVFLSDTDRFPTTFFLRQGKGAITRFLERMATFSSDSGYGGAWAVSPDGRLFLENEVVDDVAAGEGESSAEVVVESDIWKIVGTTLYYFNQYRGLQVFDLSDPGEPVQLSYLRLPALGEQLYVLESGEVVLLTEPGWGEDSELLVVDVSRSAAEVIARRTMSGRFYESRLVGTRLYTVSQAYKRNDIPVPGESYIRYYHETTVAAWDLSTPANPLAGDSFTVPYYPSAVQASSEVLMLAVSLQGRASSFSRVYLADLTSGIANMRHTAIDIDGSIPDKFKMREKDGVFTAIARVRPGWFVPPPQQRTLTRLSTYSVNFSLPVPEIPIVTVQGPTDAQDFSYENPVPTAPLGSVEMGEGEWTFATRFDGDRAYIVTFERIDPLWVIDLSDPANPTIFSELEVPGWSTYIEPMGDRLLAVGVEDNQVTVSLYDVADPSKTSMLDRVFLGDGEHWSWTEAHYDEKAVSILRNQGLILLPFQTWGNGGYHKALQLIDFDQNGLTLRGSLTSEAQIRRATLLDDGTLVSISGLELRTLDATDRDAPALLASVRLAWQVDQVIAYNGYLYQIENGNQSSWWWYDDGSGKKPRLRVTTPELPDELLAEILLPEAPIAGIYQSGTRLHLAQFESFWQRRNAWHDTHPEAPSDQEPPFEKGRYFLTTLDLSNPASPLIVGSLEVESPSQSYSSSLKALPLTGELILWASGGQPDYSIGWYDYGRVATDAIEPYWGWYGAPSLPEILVIDPSQGTPRLVSLTEIEGIPTTTDRLYQSSSASEVFLVGNQVFFSQELSYYREISTGSEKEGQPSTMLQWFSEKFLRRVDLTDPALPLQPEPLAFPGTLRSVSDLGEGHALLLADNYIWRTNESENGRSYEHGRALTASYFDGTQVYLAAQSEFYENANIVFQQDRIYRWSWNAPEVELLQWDGDRSFASVGTFPASENLQTVQPLAQDRLIIRGDRNFSLIDWADAGTPQVIGTAELAAASYYYPDFSRAVELEGRNTLALPAGRYGIDFLQFSEVTTPLPIGRAQRRSQTPKSTSADAWRAYESNWQRTRAADPDAVGSLLDLDWLFRPQAFTPLDPAATDLGDGARESTWLGRYSERYHPWTLHAEHGWMYAPQPDQNRLWYYTYDFGWLFTGTGYYPFIYRHETASWLYYWPGTGMNGNRWFFNYDPAVNAWEQAGGRFQ